MDPDIYLIQCKTKTGEWRTWWKTPFDTLEQSDDFLSEIPGITARIIRLHMTADVVRKEA